MTTLTPRIFLRDASSVLLTMLFAAHPPLRRSVLRLLRLTTLLWIGYVFLLSALDGVAIARRPGTAALPASYYTAQLVIALCGSSLTWWPGLQRRLGASYLPLLLTCLAVLPLVVPIVLMPDLPPGPLTGTPGLLGVRVAPMALLALVLVATTYPWPIVVGYCVGSTGIFLAATISSIPNALEHLWEPGIITTIYCISSLTIGVTLCLVMTKLRQQQAALAEANAQLRHHATTVEHLTVSRERNRMARELHDTLAHTLSTLIVQLETAKAYRDVDRATADTFVSAALDIARAGIHETRGALKALRAAPLEDLGLRLAICQVAEIAATTAQLQLDLNVAESDLLAAEAEQAIYRIAQEAITNVVRHARATTLKVRLSSDSRAVTLVIRDDGQGFQQDSLVPPGHFGLMGMRERAELAGGQLQISSAPGHGTTVQFTISQIQ